MVDRCGLDTNPLQPIARKISAPRTANITLARRSDLLRAVSWRYVHRAHEVRFAWRCQCAADDANSRRPIGRA